MRLQVASEFFLQVATKVQVTRRLPSAKVNLALQASASTHYNSPNSSRRRVALMRRRDDRTMRSHVTPSASPRIDVPDRNPPRTVRSASRSSRLLDTAQAFYGVLEGSTRIEGALLGTARTFNGEIANLLATGPDRIVSSSILVGASPRVLELEAEYLAINPRIAAGQGLTPGELSYDASHTTPDQIAKDQTYQELFRPYGLDWYVGSKLIENERGGMLFAVFREDRHGHLSKTEIAEFKWICKHATMAFDLMMIRDAERVSGAVSSVEAFTGCAAVMDKDGRVVETSGRFFELARRSTLFRLEADGTFHCVDARVNKRIGTLLCGITRASVEARPDLATLVLLARDPEGKLWRVRASPLPERLPWVVPGGRCLISIDEVPSGPSFDQPRLLIEAFGLTPAEAAVAIELCNGTGLRDVANRRKVSYHTVRNQAKSIFSKTGCRTQAELVQLLARMHM